MRIKLLVLVSAFFMAGIIGNPSFGFESEDISMHGFVSQGYLRSSDNNYLGNSKDGSFEFNEIGVNFAIPVSDSLQFGIQFFSRDLGETGNNELIVDWALLDYNYRAWLGFRAGKIKLPFFTERGQGLDQILSHDPFALHTADFGMPALPFDLLGRGRIGV